MYKYFLAFKYLATRRITLVSIIVMALAVMVMVIVVSVITGYITKVEEVVRGNTADLIVERADGQSIIYGHEQALQKITELQDLAERSAPQDGHGKYQAVLQKISEAKEIAERKVGEHSAVRQGDLRQKMSEVRKKTLEQAAGENLPSNYGELLRKISEVQEIAARIVYLETISSLDHIDAVAPAIERGVLVSYRNKEYQWCMLKGIDPKREMKIGKFRKYVDKNMNVEKEFSKAHGGEPPALMGQAVLRTEGVAPGQSVEITTSPTGGERVITRSFRIAGFTQSGGFDIDQRECYVPLAAAQEMLGLKSDEITHVRLQVTDQRRLTDVKFAAARALTGFEFKRRKNGEDEERVMFGNYFIMSWREKKANEIFAARNDLKILSFIVVFIFIGAGFVTMAILVMMVFEKRKDIGVLKAVGCSRHGVVTLFLLMGLIIGLSGSVLGMVSGILASNNINEIADVVEKISGREVFSKDVYYLDEIPAHLAPDAVWKILLVATGVGLVSSVAAAGRAAVIEPVRALRYE